MVDGKNADNRRSQPTYTLKRDLHLLAVLAIIGTFTRPTFLAFAIPIAYQLVQFCYRVAGSPVRVVRLLLPPFCTALLAAFVFIIADTYYFRGDFSKLVIAPYNFVKYNLSTENLADHGLHPNWLHVGVNLPMLLGPLFVWFTWCSVYEYMKPPRHRIQKVHFETDVLRQSMSSYPWSPFRPTVVIALIQIIILSLSILSVQPHQEPRFLTPLVLPIIVLAVTVELPRPGNFFWVSHSFCAGSAVVTDYMIC